ncbi:hypothetical protein LNP20_15725 [Klebsiella pneumoniae subsp. pneumoniae]|nr:hypothetical protein [Klebsiella pneumoniae subsp. pneumoniae]
MSNRIRKILRWQSVPQNAMARARNGLVHVMTDLSPYLDVEQAVIVHCWLDKVLAIVDMARIDAEVRV